MRGRRRSGNAITIASGTGRPPRVTCPSTRKPCSKTISAVASAWAGPIVTVVHAERELVMKSPAFARSVSVPSGTPAELEAAAGRRCASMPGMVGALGAHVHARELGVGETATMPRTQRPLGERELHLLRVVAGHHRLDRSARLVAQRGAQV